jgi:hypothetical protein
LAVARIRAVSGPAVYVAIKRLKVEIVARRKPTWINTMRSTSAADRNAQSAGSEKLSATERRSLNQTLAKALAFRDAGKLPEARE